MDPGAAQQSLLEFLAFLQRLNSAQLRALCQFVLLGDTGQQTQANTQQLDALIACVLQLTTLLQNATAEQFQCLLQYSLLRLPPAGADATGDAQKLQEEVQQLWDVPTATHEYPKSQLEPAFSLLLRLFLLKDALVSKFTVLALMKLYEIVPASTVIQQYQLLQQLQQLLTQLKPEALQNIQTQLNIQAQAHAQQRALGLEAGMISAGAVGGANTMEELYTQTLRSLLSLPPSCFHLYQPLRVTLHLDGDELLKFRAGLSALHNHQVFLIVRALSLPPVELLEMRNTLMQQYASGLRYSTNMLTSSVAGFAPSMLTQMDPLAPQDLPLPTEFMQGMGEEEEEDEEDDGNNPNSMNQNMPGWPMQTGKPLSLQIVEQVPSQSVYKRNLKPNPMVMVVGDTSLNDGRLFIVPVLMRCDTLTEEPKFLSGNSPVQITIGRVLTFKKLKVLTTSHQQQETLFLVKFELRRYLSEEQYEMLDSVHSSPICVVSHSTQMKPITTTAAVLHEVIPSSGPVTGGTRVGVLGANFVDSPAARVRFDTTDVMPHFYGPGTLVCHSPQHDAGSVSVRVCNSPKKWSDTAATFTYGEGGAGVMLATAVQGAHHPVGTIPEAAWSGHTDRLRLLHSERGLMTGPNGLMVSVANVLDITDERGYAALHYSVCLPDTTAETGSTASSAAQRGAAFAASSSSPPSQRLSVSEQMTNYLLEHGADLHIRDKQGNTPLYWAAHEGNLPLVQLLVEHGASLRTTNTRQADPLFAAVTGAHLAVCKQLLEYGAQANSAVLSAQGDGSSATLLHTASALGYTPIVQSLLEHGAFLHATDEEEDTALHWAARELHPDTVSALLARGASIGSCNADGETPLHLACMHHPTTHKTQAETEQQKQQQQSQPQSHLASALAALQLSAGLMAPEEASLAIVDTLLRAGADVNARDAVQQTPLHVAAACHNVSAVKRLLQAGADVFAQDGEGNTPLHVVLLHALTQLTHEKKMQEQQKQEALKELIPEQASPPSLLPPSPPADPLITELVGVLLAPLRASAIEHAKVVPVDTATSSTSIAATTAMEGVHEPTPVEAFLRLRNNASLTPASLATAPSLAAAVAAALTSVLSAVPTTVESTTSANLAHSPVQALLSEVPQSQSEQRTGTPPTAKTQSGLKQPVST